MDAVDESFVNPKLIKTLIDTGKVLAITLGGSRATGMSNANSDLDIYVLINEQIDPAVRRAIAESIADDDGSIEIGNSWWGDEDGYAIDGVWHDIVYFDAAWFFEEIDAVLNRYQAREGYSTSFVYTLAHMQPLHDPDNLIADWQHQASAYPTELTDAIIALNFPVSCKIHSCYRQQIARAVELNDAVAVNHRVAAFLATVFDIAFAVLRTWHPGEKRQLRHLEQHKTQLPGDFTEHVLAILQSAIPDRLHTLMDAVDRLVDDVGVMVSGR